MMTQLPVAQGQGDQPERDLLLEYAQVLESANGHDVTRFLEEHRNNEKLAQAAEMLHRMFDPDKSFVEQLIELRRKRG